MLHQRIQQKIFEINTISPIAFQVRRDRVSWLFYHSRLPGGKQANERIIHSGCGDRPVGFVSTKKVPPSGTCEELRPWGARPGCPARKRGAQQERWRPWTGQSNGPATPRLKYEKSSTKGVLCKGKNRGGLPRRSVTPAGGAKFKLFLRKSAPDFPNAPFTEGGY